MPHEEGRADRPRYDQGSPTGTSWDAGWDDRHGPPPHQHGRFEPGLRESFDRADTPPPSGLLSGGTAAQLAALESKVGFEEGPNNQNPFGPWQGVANAAWCDSFAQWAAVEHGGFRWPDYCQFGSKGDAYCPYTKEHAQRLGYWRSADDAPQPGWQVLFSWSGSSTPDHIGTVLRDNGDSTLTTIEGNYQDRVALVDRDRAYVVGYVALPFGGEERQDLSPAPDRRRLLRRGYSGDDVRQLQTLLSARGYDPGGIDGEFGPRTEQAVWSFQQGAALQADGIVGPLTWAALESPGATSA